jgi:hypothetical protein
MNDTETSAQGPGAGSYPGIWLSTYEYFSSGRGATFISKHHVVLERHGDRVHVRNLPRGGDSSITMDLTVDGMALTGTWAEETAVDGYYRGKRYHGAIQLIADASGSRLAGKWLGHGKDNEVNTGLWRLDFQASTSKSAIAEYDRLPND